MELEEALPREREPFTSAEFESLTRTHVRALHSIASGIVRCDDLAWDAVQETLLVFWRGSVRPVDVRGWLVRTVVHKSLHVLRARRRSARHEERAGAAREDACPLCDPLLELESRESHQQLEEALEDLSAGVRAVFLLRERSGLEYQEIGRVLRLPIGTVRSRLNRARRSLAARLGAGAGFELNAELCGCDREPTDCAGDPARIRCPRVQDAP